MAEISESQEENNLLFEESDLESEEVVLEETEEERAEKEFLNSVRCIQERLQNLPTTLPVVKIKPPPIPETKSMYLSLCEKLQVRKCSAFLSSINETKMDFSCLSFGPCGIIPVVKALTFSKVTDLNLSYNNLGKVSLPALAYLTEETPSLRLLNLSGNEIGKSSLKQLKLLILKCKSIVCLDLSHNKLGDEELYGIGKALLKNDTITDLILSYNDFGAYNAMEFGSFIARYETLKNLDLSYNHLHEGTVGVFEGLERNRVLRVLNLSHNGIPDIAALALSWALKKNKRLKELNLSCNFITSRGMKVIADGLKKNAVLEVLKFAKNPMRASGALKVIQSVNSKTKLLDLRGIEVNFMFLNSLRKLISKGRDINVLYGAEIPYDTQCKDYLNKMDKLSMMENYPLTYAQSKADEKGIDLKATLKQIHATFLWKISGKSLEKGKGKKAEPLPKKVTKKKEKETDQQAPISTKMKVGDFVLALIKSKLCMPKMAATCLARIFKDEENFVDIWNIIKSVEPRPNDISVYVKRFRRECPDTAKKPAKRNLQKR